MTSEPKQPEGPTPLQLGRHQFRSLGWGYEDISRQLDTGWASLAVTHRQERLQFIGPRSDALTLKGVLFPNQFGGLETLQALKADAVAGEAMQLVTGAGLVLGHYAVQGVKEEHRVINAAGQAEEIRFSLSLKSTDAKPAESADMIKSTPELAVEGVDPELVAERVDFSLSDMLGGMGPLSTLLRHIGGEVHQIDPSALTAAALSAVSQVGGAVSLATARLNDIVGSAILDAVSAVPAIAAALAQVAPQQVKTAALRLVKEIPAAQAMLSRMSDAAAAVDRIAQSASGAADIAARVAAASADARAIAEPLINGRDLGEIRALSAALAKTSKSIRKGQDFAQTVAALFE